MADRSSSAKAMRDMAESPHDGNSCSAVVLRRRKLRASVSGDAAAGITILHPGGGDPVVWRVYHPGRNPNGRLKEPRKDWLPGPDGAPSLDHAPRDAKLYKLMLTNLKAWVGAREAQLRAKKLSENGHFLLWGPCFGSQRPSLW